VRYRYVDLAVMVVVADRRTSSRDESESTTVTHVSLYVHESLTAWLPLAVASWTTTPHLAGPQYAMWRWVLDEVYNNPDYSDLVHRNAQGKKVLFLPSPVVPAYGNASFVALLEGASSMT
jgi:hypothetical protein